MENALVLQLKYFHSLKKVNCFFLRGDYVSIVAKVMGGQRVGPQTSDLAKL